MARLEPFTKRVFGNPISRAAGVALSSLIGSVLVGWWIADLSAGGGGVDWKKWSDTWATLAIVIFLLVLIAYTSGVYAYGSTRNSWGNPLFLKAKLTEDLYPVWLIRAKRMIEEGTPLSELERELIPDD